MWCAPYSHWHGNVEGRGLGRLFELEMSTSWVKNLTVRSGLTPGFVDLPVLSGFYEDQKGRLRLCGFCTDEC